MAWWVGIRKTVSKKRQMIVPLSFRTEEEAEQEYAVLKGAAQEDTELCQPIQAATEEDAIRAMQRLMNWE